MSLAKFSFGIGFTNIPLSNFPGRRRRKWVSFVTSGCHNDKFVYVVWHCPVIAGIAQIQLAWQHHIVPA